jgi:hypothetical protein
MAFPAPSVTRPENTSARTSPDASIIGSSMPRVRLNMIPNTSRIALAAMLSIACFACRSAPALRESVLAELASEAISLEQALFEQETPGPGVLRFSLAFGGAADLDLFVTGPNHESVYFANTPSAIGGALEADLRCDATVPRIEAVMFPDPPPGSYRVGVDFPRRCDERNDAVPFAIAVQRGDEAILAATHGAIRPGEFLTIVLETEIRRALVQAPSRHGGDPRGVPRSRLPLVPAADLRQTR